MQIEGDFCAICFEASSVRAFELSHFGQELTAGSTSGEKDDEDKLQQLHVPYN